MTRWLLVLWLLLGVGAMADPVRTASGLVRGTVADGVRIYRGIPYAAPPVGRLRWMPPEPAPSWTGVRTCDQFGPACPQKGWRHGKQSEDCLYLNVWAPADARRAPVMVFIHGGGFVQGSGSLRFYDGESLAHRGVVLVTLNYRLGPFGFLTDPWATGASGNYGLMDQIAALQWVRANIGAFGGDPHNVTIFGESAGAASVTCLMASPRARGLFGRAIAESGSPGGLDPVAQKKDQARQLAARLGCRSMDELRAVPADRLLQAAAPGVSLVRGKAGKYGPVVDGVVLPEDPTEAWAAGHMADVPFMTGTNADEGTLFAAEFPVSTVAAYQRRLAMLFGSRAGDAEKLFPASTPRQVRAQVANLVTVLAFAAPARRMVRDVARVGGHAWLYHFTRVPPTMLGASLGATHAAELPYVFGTLRRRDPTDVAISNRMQDAWVRFARSGNPGPGWPQYSIDGDQDLVFGDTVQVEQHLLGAECDLADSVKAEGGASGRGNGF